MISIVLATPAAVFSTILETGNPNDPIKICFPFPDPPIQYYPQINTIVKALIFYVIPLIIISVFYIFMARFLWYDDHMPEGLHVFNRQENRKKISKIVLLFVFIFALCFLPHHIHQLYFWCAFELDRRFQYNIYWHTLRIVAFCLNFLNSCINPIALYCVSGKFRDQFNRNLFCCWKKNRKTKGNIYRFNRAESSRMHSSTFRGTDTILMTSMVSERQHHSTFWYSNRISSLLKSKKPELTAIRDKPDDSTFGSQQTLPNICRNETVEESINEFWNTLFLIWLKNTSWTSKFWDLNTQMLEIWKCVSKIHFRQFRF